MDITLTPELAQKVADKVSAGLYADPSDVIRAGLEQLFDAEDARAKFDALIQVGLDQLDRGEGIDGEVSHQRMMARFGIRD